MMDEAVRVLVVDDHQEIRDLLAEYLTKHGLAVETADGGENMRKALEKNSFDVIILDLMMPGEDGLTLCRELRQTNQIPVIMLTAMGEETDRVVGLEVGADDYVTKPFSPRELLARIKVVVKRSRAMPFDSSVTTHDQKLTFADGILDEAKRELISPNKVVTPLSTAEYQMLKAFTDHPKMVLSRDQLMDITRGRTANVFDRSIDNQVSRLRKKIENDPKEPELIKTVWGGGYMFTANVKRVI